MTLITIQHIQIFDKYLGDVDGFARCSTKKENGYFQKDEWFLIENFLQDLELIKKGLASKHYEEELTRKLKEKVEPDAIEMLKRKTK